MAKKSSKNQKRKASRWAEKNKKSFEEKRAANEADNQNKKNRFIKSRCHHLPDSVREDVEQLLISAGNWALGNERWEYIQLIPDSPCRDGFQARQCHFNVGNVEAFLKENKDYKFPHEIRWVLAYAGSERCSESVLSLDGEAPSPYLVLHSYIKVEGHIVDPTPLWIEEEDGYDSSHRHINPQPWLYPPEEEEILSLCIQRGLRKEVLDEGDFGVLLTDLEGKNHPFEKHFKLIFGWKDLSHRQMDKLGVYGKHPKRKALLKKLSKEKRTLNRAHGVHPSDYSFLATEFADAMELRVPPQDYEATHSLSPVRMIVPRECEAGLPILFLGAQLTNADQKQYSILAEELWWFDRYSKEDTYFIVKKMMWLRDMCSDSSLRKLINEFGLMPSPQHVANKAGAEVIPLVRNDVRLAA
jgi:hypothetical protein